MGRRGDPGDAATGSRTTRKEMMMPERKHLTGSVVEESQEIIVEGWKCPDCKRRFPAPITTYISPIDGKERCAECAERQTRK